MRIAATPCRLHACDASSSLPLPLLPSVGQTHLSPHALCLQVPPAATAPPHLSAHPAAYSGYPIPYSYTQAPPSAAPPPFNPPAQQLSYGLENAVVTYPTLPAYSSRDAQPSGPFQHDGEEVGVILEGELELTVGESVNVLRTGDSFFFRSDVTHGYRNVGEGACRVVWINTPPTF